MSASVPSVRSRFVATKLLSRFLVNFAFARAVAWWTIASGAAPRTDFRTAWGSSRSSLTGFAATRRPRSALCGDVEVPITSWPRSISWVTSRVPMAPLAPATKTRIGFSFRHIRAISWVYCYDPKRRRNVTDGRTRLAGGAIRGEPRPHAGGGLPDAGLAERGGRRRAGGVDSPEPLRRGRDQGPPRLADDGRRAHISQHAAVAQEAARGADGATHARADRGFSGRHRSRARGATCRLGRPGAPRRARDPLTGGAPRVRAARHVRHSLRGNRAGARPLTPGGAPAGEQGAPQGPGRAHRARPGSGSPARGRRRLSRGRARGRLRAPRRRARPRRRIARRLRAGSAIAGIPWGRGGRFQRGHVPAAWAGGPAGALHRRRRRVLDARRKAVLNRRDHRPRRQDRRAGLLRRPRAPGADGPDDPRRLRPQPDVSFVQACSTCFCSAALPGGEIGVEQLRVYWAEGKISGFFAACGSVFWKIC